MSYSIQRAVSDGNLTSIALTIVYVDRSDIHVYVDDIKMDMTGGTTPYTWEWLSDTAITITPAVANGSVVLLRRVTKKSSMHHDFNAGAVFKDTTVDENFLQVLYIAQEAIEGGSTADFYNDLDLHGYTVHNSGPALVSGDLISLGQYQSDALGAYAYRKLSERYANAPHGTQVEPGKYSAFHWATVAASSIAGVASINGRTGNVTLNKGDVNLSSVDDTSDMDKPVSTAQQLVLDQHQLVLDQHQLVLDQHQLVLDQHQLGLEQQQLVLDQKFNTADLHPSMTGSITLNGTTDNAVVMTNIVTALGLEAGDVIRIDTGTYNKLHTVESVTYNSSIIVNYEHAGNRGNGALKLPDFTGQATVTRIAKWFNAPMGLGQSWVDMTSRRMLGVVYTQDTGRAVEVSVYTVLSSISISGITVEIDGNDLIKQEIGGGSSVSKSVFAIFTLCSSETMKVVSSTAIVKWWERR